MAKKFLTPIDLTKNELQNAVVQNLASAPSTPLKGQVYFNSTGGDNTLYWYDGSGWVAAKAPSTSGITQAEGDTRYVNVTGDAMTGTLEIVENVQINGVTTPGGAVLGSIVFETNSTVIGGPPSASRVKIQAPLYTNCLEISNTEVLSYHPVKLPNADPLDARHATRKAYVDAQILTRLDQVTADFYYLALAGGIMTGALTLNADPVSALHAATKQYVDNLQAGLAWKDAVRAATTVNITLSGLQTVDGVSLASGDRVLVKNQSSASANGVWIAVAGGWTRATDADSESDLLNMAVFVAEGTTQADTAWVGTANAPITVNTTNLPYTQFAGTGGSIPPNRLINTTLPLAGGGDLSADRTLTVNAATTALTGVSRLSTTAEATAQTDNVTSVTPLGLADRVKTSLTLTGTAPIAIDAAHTAQALSANRTVSLVAAGVANSHLATMAANTVKMNNTGGVAAPTDVTVALLKTAIGGIPTALPVPVTEGGSGRATATTAYGLIAAGTTATGVEQTVTPAASGWLKTTSTTALPTWAAITNADVSGLGALATLATVGTAQITNDAVDNTKLANSPANTIKGNNTGSAADPLDLTPAQVKTLLAIASTDVSGLGSLATKSAVASADITDLTIATGDIANNAVDNTKVADMAANSIKGNITGSAADPIDMTVAQAKTLLGFTGKYSLATVGGATSQVITHNLNTQAVVVNVYRTLTPWDTVECDIERTTVNTCTLRFAVAPATNEYSVVVVG